MTNLKPQLTAVSTSPQRRIAGVILIAGPAIFWLGEFISAAAWTHPAYSYTADFISDLGVRGPSTLFGQYMYSPLASVMNTSFFLFGITIAIGVFLLNGLSGLRRAAVLAAAVVLAIGGVLLAVFPGSGEALKDGTGQYHSLGAFSGFLAGNILVIMLGTMRRRLGFSRTLGKSLVAAGVIGLISTLLYLVAIFTSGDTIIGIVGIPERGAVYPLLIGLLVTGISVVRRQTPVNAEVSAPIVHE
jgi:hypothetical membrane protein